MSTLPIIVYGDGDLYREYFSAIAATFGASDFSTLMRIAILLSGVTVLFSLIMKRDLMVIVKWFALYYVAVFMLFTPKSTIIITDRVNNDIKYAVDGVPLGLAMIASYTSFIGDALTINLESIFSMPDYMPYHKTGMVFASRLVEESSQFEISDPTFDENLSEFVHQCVFYDILLNKYSLTTLETSPNLWDLVTKNASPARAFLYNEKIVTCQAGSQYLTKDWKNIIESTLSTYANRLYPHLSNEKAKSQITKDLGFSYSYLTKISENAKEIMQQNLMANAIQRGILSFGSKLDASAAMESYAYVRAQEQKRLTNKTIGDMTADWLPKMKIAIEAVLYGSFIFIVLLSVFPFGGAVLLRYIYTLLWIQMWSPMYAILNLMISYNAQVKSAAATGGAFSMHAMSGIMQINSDIAGLAGYLTLSVPFLSYGIVKGMAGTFTQLSQYVGSVIQSSGGSASAEAISGNINLGNSSIGNHNTNNVSANHFDTSTKMASGFITTQLSGGSQLTMTPDGSSVMNMQNAMSNIGTSVDFGEALRASYAHQAEKAYSARLSDMKGYSESTASSTRDIGELSKHWGISKASGESWAFSTNASTGRALGHIQTSIKDYADRHHISYDQASNVLANAYADLKVSGGFDSNRTLAGKALGFTTGASISVTGTGGVSSSTGISHSTNKGSQFTDAESYIKNSNYSENVDIVSRAIYDKNLRVGSEEGARLVNNTNVSLDQSKSFRADSQSQYEKSERASEYASLAQEQAENIRINASQEYSHWLMNQPGTNGKGRLGAGGVEGLKDDHVMSQYYADQYLQKIQNDFESKWSHGLVANEQGIQKHYQSNNHEIRSSSDVKAGYQYNQGNLSSIAKKEKIYSSDLIDYSVKNKVNDLSKNAKQQMNTEKYQLLSEQNNHMKKVLHEESNHV